MVIFNATIVLGDYQVAAALSTFPLKGITQSPAAIVEPALGTDRVKNAHLLTPLPYGWIRCLVRLGCKGRIMRPDMYTIFHDFKFTTTFSTFRCRGVL